MDLALTPLIVVRATGSVQYQFGVTKFTLNFDCPLKEDNSFTCREDNSGTTFGKVEFNKTGPLVGESLFLITFDV